MIKPTAILSPFHHRGAKHIKVDIANNYECKQLVRSIPGRKWSQTKYCWYMPYTSVSYKKLKKLFEVKTDIGAAPEQTPDPVSFQEKIEGPANGRQYGASSLQAIFVRALEKSRVNPYATLHTLRHSYLPAGRAGGRHPLRGEWARPKISARSARAWFVENDRNLLAYFVPCPQKAEKSD